MRPRSARGVGRRAHGSDAERSAARERSRAHSFTQTGKKVGIVVVFVKGDLIKSLDLDQRLKVSPISSNQVLDATGLRTAFVEGVVIDLDRETVATIASLRHVFPELRIVALSSSPAGLLRS